MGFLEPSGAMLDPFPNERKIDVFARPGGLGEGFSAYRTHGGHAAFKNRLSIEKEGNAHRTLQLRALVRQFKDREVPEACYRLLRQRIYLSELCAAFPEQATATANEAIQLTLGPDSREVTRGKIGLLCPRASGMV